jgi:hypothetical protein
MDIVAKGQGHQTHDFGGEGPEKETSNGAVEFCLVPRFPPCSCFLPRKIIVDVHDNEMAGWKYLTHVERETNR